MTDISDQKLPNGMTKIPTYWPELSDAFISFSVYAIGQEHFVKEFQTETGLSLEKLVNASALEQLIDNASGHTDSIVARFLDYLVEFYWGEEPPEANKGE